jgi:hypothetical protein
MKILQKMKTELIKNNLKRIVAKKCPVSIPRSGEEGKNIRCYVSWIVFSNEKRFLVDGINEIGVVGKWLDSNLREYCVDGNISFEDITPASLMVCHYYGNYETRYSNLWDLVLYDCTKMAILRAEIHKIYNSIAQFLFNQRPLVAKKRFEVLNILVIFPRKSGHFEEMVLA